MVITVSIHLYDVNMSILKIIQNIISIIAFKIKYYIHFKFVYTQYIDYKGFCMIKIVNNGFQQYFFFLNLILKN